MVCLLYKCLHTSIGRQIFERGNIVADEDVADEDGVCVDVSQYDRRAAREEEEEIDRVHFSDSE